MDEEQRNKEIVNMCNTLMTRTNVFKSKAKTQIQILDASIENKLDLAEDEYWKRVSNRWLFLLTGVLGVLFGIFGNWILGLVVAAISSSPILVCQLVHIIREHRLVNNSSNEELEQECWETAIEEIEQDQHKLSSLICKMIERNKELKKNNYESTSTLDISKDLEELQKISEKSISEDEYQYEIEREI